MTHVHICRSEVMSWKIRRIKCPNCGKRRMLMQTFDWYDPRFSCLNCGDEWSGGERMERPFARGWRERAVADLKRTLERLQATSPTASTSPTGEISRVILGARNEPEEHSD
jgi:hypothetical protein